jgi:hypothetical protein
LAQQENLNNDPVRYAAKLSDLARNTFYKSALEYSNKPILEQDKASVIFGILVLAFEHYDGLIEAHKEKPRINTIAYHARSLLELFMWTKFCLDSDDNIIKLHKSALNDAKDLVDKFSEFSEKSNGNYNFNAQAANDRLINLAKEKGYDHPIKKYLEIHKCDFEKELYFYYNYNNKFLSKFVHPCGFNIVGMLDEATCKLLSLYIIDSACNWHITIITKLPLLIGLNYNEHKIIIDD